MDAPAPHESLDTCWSRIGVWGRERPRCPELERYTHCRNCPVFARAGQRHLMRPLPANYRQEAARGLAVSPPEQTNKRLSLLVLRLGEEWFGFSAATIIEVCEMRPIHALPHRGDVVRGLVNVRGELHVCVALGHLLKLNKSEMDIPRERGTLSYDRLVLTRAREGTYAIPASEVLGTRRYDETTLREPPNTLSKGAQAFTRGVLREGEHTVAVLDHDAVFRALAEHLA